MDENVIWRSAFAQAFNYWMQSRALTPPGFTSTWITVIPATDSQLKEATRYAKAMADLAYTSHMAIYSAPNAD